MIDKRSQTWTGVVAYAENRIADLQVILEDVSSDETLTATTRGCIREMRDLIKLTDADEKLDIGDSGGDYGVDTH